MKRFTFLKAFVLSCLVAAISLLPMSLNAQNKKSDDFFKNDDFNGDGWRDAITFSGISNYGIGETVPVDGGLLILASLGAGYAVARRKRKINSREGVSLFLAFALILCLTQCKKNLEQIVPNAGGDNDTYITLNVGDGSKVGVDPTGGSGFATVTFEEGDQLYVVYKKNNVGVLTYGDADHKYFSGSISDGLMVDDTQLEFYYFGSNVNYTDFAVEYSGAFNEFRVNILDQSEHYPVISYGKSDQVYTGAGNYSAKLENKCSIVKFTTTGVDPSGLAITNMKNRVVVNITNGSYTYTTKEGSGGLIKLHKKAAQEFWGVMLPQTVGNNVKALAPGMASLGNITVPNIGVNQYISGDDAVSVTDLKRVFTTKDITDDYEQVIFAPGNLQNTDGISGTWKFAANQWTILGSNSGETDLFQWGKYNGHLNIETDLGSDWKLIDTYLYLITTRPGKLWGIGCLEYNGNPDTPSGIKGLILFPDNWNKSTPSGFEYENVKIAWKGTNMIPNANRFNHDQWVALENAGCVFLPCAGYYNQSGSAYTGGDNGFYWGASSSGDNGYYMKFNEWGNGMDPYQNGSKNMYYSVRPVRVLNTAKVTW